MQSFQYAHAENDSIHITPSSPPFDLNNDRTLCGLPTLRMYWGDETLSGMVATCKTCRKIIRNRIVADYWGDEKPLRIQQPRKGH